MPLRCLYPDAAEDLDPREFPEAFTYAAGWEPEPEPDLDDENFAADPLKHADEMPNDMNPNFPPEGARLYDDDTGLDGDTFVDVSLDDELEDLAEDDR
jgi:hypothetical protein